MVVINRSLKPAFSAGGGAAWDESGLNPDLQWAKKVFEETNLEGHPYKTLELTFADEETTSYSYYSFAGDVLKTSDGQVYENATTQNIKIEHTWDDTNAKNAEYYVGEKLRWTIKFSISASTNAGLINKKTIYFISNNNISYQAIPSLKTFDLVDTGKLYFNSTNQTITGESLERVPSFQRYVSSSLTKYIVKHGEARNLTSVKIDYDTSTGTDFGSMFRYCSNLRNVPYFDTSSATAFGSMFAYCSNLRRYQTLDSHNVTNFANMFQSCSLISEIDIGDTSNGTNFTYFVTSCSQLKTLKNLNLINATNVSYMFNACTNLKNLDVKNIKMNIQIGSGGSYGHLLTLESLTNTIKELWNNSAGSSVLTLTIGSTNLEKLANVYVKLIDITDEMRAEDEYIDNKLPFVVCESTDEGAMLITEYVISKNWQLK